MTNSRFKPSFKPSLPDTLRANNKAMEFYSAMSGKPTPDGAMREVKAKVTRQHGLSEIPLEKDIQKAIIQFLSAHPKISIYGRFNSGTAITGDAQGNTRYTRFNSIKGFPDIHGMLKGGRAVYIEVKRPGGRVSEEQQEFIDKVSAHGAVAFVAYSVDDVIQNFKRLGV
jgi:hypothetical protein